MSLVFVVVKGLAAIVGILFIAVAGIVLCGFSWVAEYLRRLIQLPKENRDFRHALSKEDKQALSEYEYTAENLLSLAELKNWIKRRRVEEAIEAVRDQWNLEMEERDRLGELLHAAEQEELAGFRVSNGVAVSFVLEESRTILKSDGDAVILPEGRYGGWISLRRVENTPDDDPRLACDFVFEWGAGKLHSITYISFWEFANIDEPPLCDSSIYWPDAPDAWRAAFQNGCILIDFPRNDDGRNRFQLEVGDQSHEVFTKFRCWKMDLAVCSDGRTGVIRAREVLSEIWKHHPIDSGNEWLDFARIPCICCEFPIEMLLPITAETSHFMPNQSDFDEWLPPIYRDAN